MAVLGTSPFTITTTGDWEIPAGVSSIQVEAWAGGAGGAIQGANSKRGGGGGGGGAYAKTNSISVTPLGTYTFTVGASVGEATNGNPSSMTGDAGSVVAAGGTTANTSTGGAGGTVAASTGDVAFAGGAGGSALGGNNDCGAGSGEGA